jgi:hypothetical protein
VFITHLARLLATFIVVVISTATVNAQVLLEHRGTTYKTQSNILAPLAEVVVGAKDVHIGSFGVFGQTSVPTNVRWVIFDSLAPLEPAYLSEIHWVPGETGSFATQGRWYDSPAMEFTLLANHRYAMGILADRLGTSGFRWGMSITRSKYGGGGPAIVAEGLDVPFSAALANAGLAGTFYSTPFAYTFNRADPLEWNDAVQPSLRIMSPVAEPGEWAMLLSGLMLIVWVSRRRKARPE